MKMETTQTQQKKLPKIKPKEKEFAKQYVINDNNGTQTVKDVYNIEDDKYASVKAVRLIGKDSIVKEIEIQRETLKSALIKKGITPEKIADKINVLLNAKEEVWKNNNATGEIELVSEKIDYTAVDKGLKHATSIYGVEDPDDKPKTNTTYNFIFSSEVQDKVKAINEVIKNKLITGNV